MSTLVFNKEDPDSFIAGLRTFLDGKQSNLLVFDDQKLFEDFSQFLVKLDNDGKLPADLKAKIDAMFRHRSEKKLLLRINGVPTSCFSPFEVRDIFACVAG